MIRLALMLLLLLCAPAVAHACQYGMAGGPTTGLYSIGKQTLTLTTAAAVSLTLPTTFSSGGNTVISVDEAMVYVTSGTINMYDNGETPTTSTTSGGAAFGAGTAGGPVFDICGSRAVSLAKFIAQTGSATIVVLFYGTGR